MNTTVVRHSTLGLAAGLVLFLGCARPSAETEQPKTVVAPAPMPVAVAQAAPAPTPQPVAQTAPAAPPVPTDTNTPAVVETIPPVVAPQNVAMTPGLAEVVKLVQAGVAEDVILAYVEKHPAAFNVGADQILYLNDLGASSTVITALLKHDGNAATAAAAAPAAVQTQVVSNVPANQAPPAAAPAQATAPVVETAVAPPAASTEVAYFYDALSPYGSWVYLSGYGWCWQPTVAVTVAGWRPYSDRGRWYWSDAGWYWNSDYSWGWAPFHYGRWYHHGHRGWVWTPDLVWGPSWVSWRYYDGYCGWAPLPPHARYRHGVGFTYYGSSVSVGFDFGLTSFHYSFVSVNNFCDYEPRRHFVPRHHADNHYRNARVVNNYVVNNNTVINRGVGRETIAARAGQGSVREVSLRERPVQNLANARAERVDQVERRGNESVVYRPTLPSTPPPVRTAVATRSTGQGSSTVARGSTGIATGVGTPATGVRSGVPVTGGSTAPTRVGRAQETKAPEVQRGQPAVTRGNTVETPRTTTTTRGETPTRAQEQPRTGRSLFGDSGATTPAPSAPVTSPRSTPAPATAPRVTTPQTTTRSTGSRGENTATAPVAPRTQTPANTPGVSPNSRVYSSPATPARQPERVYGRVETQAPSAPRTVAPSRSYDSGVRSAPSPAPSQGIQRSAPSPAPSQGIQRSAPAPAPARQSSGGGVRDGGSRGVERGDRGR